MAICLCGKTNCRGAFLSYSGNDALQSALHENHGPLQRLASICHSSSCWNNEFNVKERETKRKKTSKVPMKPFPDCTIGIPQRYRLLLRDNGLDECVLNGLPTWLLHFAASALEFSELEKTVLPQKLAEWLKMTRGIYRKASGLPESLPDREEKIQIKKEHEDSLKEAIGVQQQRITCLTASLDMARHVICEDIIAAQVQHSGVNNNNINNLLKSMPPPVVPLCDDEVISLLWTADFSVAKRLVWILETECAVVRGSKKMKSLPKKWICGRKELSVHRDTVEDARNGLRKLLGHMKEHPLWTYSPSSSSVVNTTISSSSVAPVVATTDLMLFDETRARSAKQRLLAAWDETMLWINTRHFFRLNTAKSTSAAKKSLRNLEHIRGELEMKRKISQKNLDDQKRKEGMSLTSELKTNSSQEKISLTSELKTSSSQEKISLTSELKTSSSQEKISLTSELKTSSSQNDLHSLMDDSFMIDSVMSNSFKTVFPRAKTNSSEKKDDSAAVSIETHQIPSTTSTTLQPPASATTTTMSTTSSSSTTTTTTKTRPLGPMYTSVKNMLCRPRTLGDVLTEKIDGKEAKVVENVEIVNQVKKDISTNNSSNNKNNNNSIMIWKCISKRGVAYRFKPEDMSPSNRVVDRPGPKFQDMVRSVKTQGSWICVESLNLWLPTYVRDHGKIFECVKTVTKSAVKTASRQRPTPLGLTIFNKDNNFVDPQLLSICMQSGVSLPSVFPGLASYFPSGIMQQVLHSPMPSPGVQNAIRNAFWVAFSHTIQQPKEYQNMMMSQEQQQQKKRKRKIKKKIMKKIMPVRSKSFRQVRPYHVEARARILFSCLFHWFWGVDQLNPFIDPEIIFQKMMIIPRMFENISLSLSLSLTHTHIHKLRYETNSKSM